MTEIEKLFNQEVREKKKTAKGVKNLASRKKGFKGKVLTQVDYLKGKEKRQYMAASKVEELPILYSCFLEKSNEERKQLLTQYLEKYETPKKLAEVWIPLGLPSQDMIYNWAKKYKINYKQSKRSKPMKDITFSLAIKLSGTMRGEDLANRLMDIANVLKADEEYDITLEIKE